MARVLLIFPKPNRIAFDTTWTVNLGLAYLGAALQKRGHEVLVCDQNIDPPTRLGVCLRGTDLACIYTVTATLKAGRARAPRIKVESPATRVALGGPHITARPEDGLASPHVDFACVGEGEALVCDLVENLDHPTERGRIPGLCYRGADGRIAKNGSGAAPPNLDDLPYPAYHLFPVDRMRPTRPTWVRAKGLRCGTMMTSRGCPFRCNFCTSAVGSPFAKRFRAMSPKRAADEIEWMARRWGVNFLEFQDDVFNLDVDRATELCEELIRRDLGVRWSIPNGISRVENVTEEFLRLCKRSGCVDAWFAAESGSARIRDEVIRKQNNLEQVRAAVHAARRVRLATGGFFVFGSPDETVEEMQQTIDLACALPLDRAQFSIAVPFPGTQLWDRIDREGRWLERDTDAFGPFENIVYFELGRMRAADVTRMYKKAFRSFYLRPSYLARNVLLNPVTYSNLPLLARQSLHFFRPRHKAPR